MSDPLPLEGTEYAIPLTDEQLIELGRFAATFSQIDFLMGEVIALHTKAPWHAMMLMLDNATTGPRLNMLRKLIPGIKDKKAKQRTRDVCSRMNSLIDKRNHVIHGLWRINS